MRRALVACIIGVSAAACLFPALDGLSGDAGAGDAGASDAGDASLDAPNDMNTADAADAPIVDAKPSFSCASVDAKLCDDFDDSDAQTFTHWSSLFVFNGTVVRAASDASPPFDVRFDAYQWSDGGASSYALLHRGFVDSLTKSATLSFDIRVDQYPSSNADYFNTADLAFSGQATGTNLFLGVSKAGLQETVKTDAGAFTYPQHPLTKGLQVGVWTHVDIQWSLSSNANTVQVSFDKQIVLPATTLDSRQTYGIPLLTMGVTYVSAPADHAAFELDDVVLDFQ